MNTINRIRDAVRLCRNTDNIGCIELIQYRDRANAEGASHPLLFQAVPRARVMIIGAVPGPIDSSTSKVDYQKLVDGQFSLGHRSAKGLGEIMMRVGKLGEINLPADITLMPTKESVQRSHLSARRRLRLHVTNLVKCNARASWERTENATWRRAARACERRHLEYEIAAVDPQMVVLLGQEVAAHFAIKESWGSERKRLKISAWAENADYLPFHGKNRFVTAWAHPGGNYFWIQGRKHWSLYAQQLAEFVR